MTYVVCFLMMSGHAHKAHGILVEWRGDNWLVAFKTKTLLVNGNACLIKEKK